MGNLGISIGGIVMSIIGLITLIIGLNINYFIIQFIGIWFFACGIAFLIIGIWFPQIFEKELEEKK